MEFDNVQLLLSGELFNTFSKEANVDNPENFLFEKWEFSGLLNGREAYFKGLLDGGGSLEVINLSGAGR